MTPAELKNARHALGLSAEGFARLVHVSGGRTVRRWEAGDCPIPGSIEVVLRLLRERDGERDAREKCQAALRGKDEAMGVLFDRLTKAGVDCSDLIS